MKNMYDLAIWINSIVDDYFVKYNQEDNEIQVCDFEDGEVIYWFKLDDFEI
ncbi:hypothetical protein M0Q03_03585 [bacterium]|jgi:hypothetical protein|nr:hypothetical protein [bacterium]